MNKCISIVFLLFSSSLFAINTYKLDFDLSLNGKTVSRPRIIIDQGKEGIISQEDDKGKNKTEISIIAKESKEKDRKEIFLDFKISHQQKGLKKFISNNKILVNEGEMTLLKTLSNDDQGEMAIRVSATRINL